MLLFYKKSWTLANVCPLFRMISVTRFSVNEVIPQQNVQDNDNKQSKKDNVSTTQKSKCVVEHQSKKYTIPDEQISNLDKAINKMNKHYD